ncbi:MAG: tetratricopeptide repeat protein [Candidatus Magasanikbacteria bacterium]|nr:tetratricopeptide repeat protein [Candidatus Magasanikbacteria bacterium]
MKLFRHKWNIIERLPFWCLLSIVVLLPLVFSSLTSNTLLPIKELVFFLLLVCTFMASVVRLMVKKSFILQRTILDIPLILSTILFVSSVIWSSHVRHSVFGFSDQFVLHGVVLFGSVVFCWFLLQEVKTKERLNAMIAALCVSAVLSCVWFFLLHSPFASSITEMVLAGVRVSNTVSASHTGFGMYLISIFLLSFGLVLQKQLALLVRVLFWSTAFITGATIVAIGFPVLWKVSAVGIALLVLAAFLFRKRLRESHIIASFILLISAIFFSLFGAPQTLQKSLPAEVALGSQLSWSMTKDVLLRSIPEFLIGSGPGTFLYTFSSLRPAIFNTSDTVETIRFAVPFNTVFAMLGELGFLGTVSMLMLLLVGMGGMYMHAIETRRSVGIHRLDHVVHHNNGHAWYAYTLFFGFIVSTVGMAIIMYDLVLFVWWWLLLALFVSAISLTTRGVVEEKKFTVRVSSEYRLLLSFIVVVVCFVLVVFGAFAVRLYSAERWFSKAQYASLDRAEQSILLAIEKRPWYAPYHTALAEVALEQAKKETQKSDEQRNDMFVAQKVAQAVNAAQRATDIAPLDVYAWETRGVLYMNARLVTPEANGWAKDSVEQALRLAPTHAVLYWRLGNIFEFSKELDKAEAAYRQAIAIKPNYLAAYQSLATLLESTQKIDEVIVVYETAFEQVATLDGAYQLGRALFNRNTGEDDDRAEDLWLSVLREEPRHANTLYSLGLLYERRGEYDTALGYYQTLREVDPANADVQRKIRALSGGGN